MISRLATMEWFTARISAATLISASYKRLTKTQQEEHVNHFAALCKDETPMVRRVASQHLGLMLQEVVTANSRSCLEEGGSVGAILVPLYELLASNEQPVSFFMIVFTMSRMEHILTTFVSSRTRLDFRQQKIV